MYAAGNVLTGKGNIKDSLVSGTFVGIHVAESYLGLNGDDVPVGRGRAQGGGAAGRADRRRDESAAGAGAGAGAPGMRGCG